MKHFKRYLEQNDLSDELIELHLRDVPAGSKSFTVVPQDYQINISDTVVGTTSITHTKHQIVFLSTPGGSTVEFACHENSFWTIELEEWKLHWQQVVHKIQKK